jgi:4-hydroxythreonine-4-phosphate dehydrogenase
MTSCKRTDWRPIAITMGDAAGIGPEIIAKAFARRPEWARQCFVAGDLGVMRRAVQVAGLPLAVAVIERPDDVLDLPVPCLPVLPAVTLSQTVQWGAVQAHAGRAAADAIAWAAKAALRKEVGAVVTAPIHKEALALAGIPFPGHTEYLQYIAAEAGGRAVSDVPVRMMLSNDVLRTVLVSIHVSLRQAIDAVTYDNVLQTLRITDRHFRVLTGRPIRMAVAGLNPHAGEGGLFGTEEVTVIAPAIEQARTEGMLVSGPHTPDTVFMRARQGEFDVVVAMYHDQGLIPVKYLGLEHGVNTTLGLSFVRTSPDHGTAFDLAGTGRADPSSLMAAIEAAMGAVA